MHEVGGHAFDANQPRSSAGIGSDCARPRVEWEAHMAGEHVLVCAGHLETQGEEKGRSHQSGLLQD
jgi:hypothetical protein